MCGRFIQVSNPDKIKVQISDLEVPNEVREGFRPRYNIAPTQNILTVLNTLLTILQMPEGLRGVLFGLIILVVTAIYIRITSDT